MTGNTLFMDAAVIRHVTWESRKPRTNVQKVAEVIQKQIDYAAEHGRAETIVYTGEFYLAAAERKDLSTQLSIAGYQQRWRSCNNEDERIHVWWAEEKEDDNV